MLNFKKILIAQTKQAQKVHNCYIIISLFLFEIQNQQIILKHCHPQPSAFTFFFPFYKGNLPMSVETNLFFYFMPFITI